MVTGPVQFTKPGIFEADMHDSALRELLPGFAAFFHSDSLRDALAAQLPGLQLRSGTQSKVVKLQCNTGGGACFPLHYDNPGRPNRRKV